MIRKTISIPEGMANYINSRMQSGQFGNDSEYFRDLVRADQARQEKQASRDAFQTMIDEALASGESDKTLDQIIDEARKRARKSKSNGL